MPPKERKSTRTVLKSQAKEMICKVYEFMKREATEKFTEKFTDARWRTAKATGVSERTVSRLLTEQRQARESGRELKSPIRKVREPKRLEVLTIELIRQTIQTHYMRNKVYPSLSDLKTKIKFEESSNTLRRTLHKLGYFWRQDKNKKIMAEKHNIQTARLKYLKTIKQLRNAGRPIFYIGEIYFNTNQLTILKDTPLAPGCSGETKLPKTGMRINLLLVGGSHGFIHNAIMIYKDDKNSTDSSNADYFLQWVQYKLLPNLPPNAVVVMEDAPCNNTISEAVPNANSSYQEMIDWLRSKNIKYNESHNRLELYSLILKKKGKFQNYKVDELLKQHTIEVLRLPAYHPELNVIEHIWRIMKMTICKEENIGVTYEAVVHKIQGHFQRIDCDFWTNVYRYVQKLEDDYMAFLNFDFH